MLNDDLLNLLVCPLGLAPLRRQGDILVCSRCGLEFSIQDGIPNMLIEEARLPEGCDAIDRLPCVRSGDARPT